MKMPEQWKVAKTIPVFKNKGEVNDLKNYSFETYFGTARSK
jgi:hypothetical protein